MPELHHMGRVTYEAYASYVRKYGTSGRQPNAWIDLGAEEQDAWQAAAVACVDESHGVRNNAAPWD